MSDTGQVLDARMELVSTNSDWMSDYIANLWCNWTTSQEWYDRIQETLEVRQFVYSTDTTTTSNRTNPWSHKTARPKICQIADTLKAQYVAALLPHDDVIQFQANTEDANKLEIKYLVEGYIRSRHKLYDNKSVVQELIDDWVEDGNAFVITDWESQTAELQNDGGSVRGYVGPRQRRVDPFRIAFNTRAESFNEAPKIIQSVKTIGDIARDIQNERLSEDYREVLTRALEFRQYVGRNSHLFSEEWLDTPMHGWSNYGSYWSGEHVELLTFYGSVFNTNSESGELHLNRKIVVIDRKWVLMDESIGTWDGNPPIRHVAWRKRPNSLLGMGPLANLTGMQYYINHMENAKADALDKMITQDRVFRGIDDVVQNPDGSLDYFVHETGDVQNLGPDTTILSADQKIELTEQKMEEYAGVPPESFGFKTPGEQTKFEVSERLNRSGIMFRDKTDKFENKLMLPAVNDELETAAKHADGNLEIPVKIPEGEVFATLNADTLKSKGTLIPVGAQFTRLQQQYAQDLAQFTQTLQLDPEVVVHFPAKKIAEAWSTVLTAGSRKGLFQEYGRIAERVELAQHQQAADETVAQNSSVSSVTPDGLAPSPIDALEGQPTSSGTDPLPQ